MSRPFKLTKKNITLIMTLTIAILTALGVVSHQTIQKDPGTYEVVKVVDGDTLDVNINGVRERIRLIGINTPETVDPRRPVECFGRESSAHAKELLEGNFVKLEYDASQDTRDAYDRLLAYVILPDGTNFNKRMIAEGYAYEYTYEKVYAYQAEFKAAQNYAESNKLGLWADGVCQS